MIGDDWHGGDDLATVAYLDGARGDWRSDDWPPELVDDYGRWWDLGTIDAVYVGEHAFYDLPGEVPGLPKRVGE